MKILIACEYSGTVRDAFTRLGHDVTSCDILPSETNGKHYQGDVLDIINDGWDMMIAHPPCTYLSYAATRVWNKPGRAELREDALQFFLTLYNAPIPKICVENPVGYMNTVFMKPTQIIHPYYFGEPYMKQTCLWLKELPKLIHPKPKTIEKPKPIYVCSNGKNAHWCDAMTGGKNKAKNRSKTFQSIANAMAEQWGGL